MRREKATLARVICGSWKTLGVVEEIAAKEWLGLRGVYTKEERAEKARRKARPIRSGP